MVWSKCFRSASATTILLSLSACGRNVAQESHPVQQSGAVDVELRLKLPVEVKLRHLRYAVTAAGGDLLQEGAFDVYLAAALVAPLEALAPGAAYRLQLRGTSADGRITCVADERFELPRGTGGVTVSPSLDCGHTGDATVLPADAGTDCSIEADIIIEREQLAVGEQTVLKVDAMAHEVPDEALTWSATSGSLEPINAWDASFVCGSAGRVTFQVSGLVAGCLVRGISALECLSGQAPQGSDVDAGGGAAMVDAGRGGILDAGTPLDADMPRDMQTPVCGNGILEGDEACDDGTRSNADSCKDDVAGGGDCTVNECGDGVLWVGKEECDDGNLSNGDACKDDRAAGGDCSFNYCGDGVLNPAEEMCDEGEENGARRGSPCTSDCKQR